MRLSVPPVRFSEPEYVARARRVVLTPFHGQATKYKKTVRLPEVVIKRSGIRNAGLGLFLREPVRAGQIITLYPRNIISEAEARRRQNKVFDHLYHLF